MKLARARGPAGGLLTVAVEGPHAPQLQMLLPLLRERVNAALGPGAVGRIQLTQAAHGFAEAAGALAAKAPRPQADARRTWARSRATLSSIGDGGLRDALETLARNVLSRAEIARTGKLMPMTLTRRQTLAAALAAAAAAGLPRLALAQATPAVAEMSLGDPNAPVTLVEYAMFTCPHCAAFAQDVLPKIKANFIDTGKVRLVFREVYFNKPASGRR